MNTSHDISAQSQPVSAQQYTPLSQEQRHGSQDVQAFQTFYQENLNLIYRYIYSKVGNREDAEDLTSQTFMKAVRGIDHGQNPLSMQKWLFQVARTTVADYWRAYYRAPASSLEALLDAGWEGPSDDHEVTDPLLTQTAPVERVQRILAALPANYREVLQCRFLLNLSIKETAACLSLTEANVKVLQFRALKRAADLEPIIVNAH